MSLIQYANNAFIERERENAKAIEQAAKQLMAVESDLAAHIRKAWERNRDHKRRTLEPRLLSCLRQRNGEYDPDVKAEIAKTGGSDIYMMLTATKCRAAMAWVRDILLPAGDRAWSLDATPVPEVPPQFMAAIRRHMAMEVQQELQQMQAEVAQAQAQGQPAQMPSGDDIRAELQKRIEARAGEIKQAAQERAEDAASKMTTLVADQLAEGGYDDALEQFIDDFVTFPFAIMKGPTKRRRPTLKWGDGWQPVQGFEIRDEVERISPFDIYPSPDAVHINDGELCERIRFSRSALYEAIDLEGWNKDQIREVLREYGEGGLRMWLWDETERAELEGRDLFQRDDERIDGVHYWGRAQGRKLLEWGMSSKLIDDPLGEYEIEAILIGRYVVRAVLNRDPLQRRPYYKASFHGVPGAWAGMGLPELMTDIQRMCNATARALVNNMALASGPLLEVFADRLADGETAQDIYPWRIFYTKSDPTGGGGNNRAIQFYQPSINSAALLQVFEWFERKADDATNVPRYAYGNEKVGGAGRTASGLSMLMESASKGIRAAISHVDQGVIRPLIRRLYYENMLYSRDQSIKGDLKVVARGAAALVAKDSAHARRMEALQLVSNPIGMQVVGIEGYAEILREIFRGADMPEGIIPTKDEIAQRAQQPQPPSPEEIEAQQKEMQMKLDAAEKDRRFGLDVKKFQVDAADVQHDNALADAKFQAEQVNAQREAMNAPSKS